jgi:ubiquinone/menaquinone biosynthesis C-methylase UbiE
MLQRIRRSWHRIGPEGEPAPVAWFYSLVVANSSFMKSFYDDVAREVATAIDRGTILDIGTGPGRLPLQLARLLPEIKVVGLDVSRDMIRAAARTAEKEGMSARVSFVNEDAANLPFDDASFDLVVSTASLHHWKNPLRILNEAHRVLKQEKEAWIYDIRTDLPQLMRGKLRGCGCGLIMSYLVSTGVSAHSGLSLAELKAILDNGAGRFRQYQLAGTWNSGPFLKITLSKDSASPSSG